MTFSIAQAAKKLNLHPKTLRRWESSGKYIPRRTLGNQRRYSPSDITKLKAIKSGALIPTTVTKNKILNLNQVAEKFHVSPATIRRWTHEGKLKTPYTQSQISKLKSPASFTSVPERNMKRNIQPLSHIPWLKNPKLEKAFIYTTIVTIFLTLGITSYLIINQPDKISSPSIKQLDLTPDIEVALPQVANFLSGQITIGTDTGTLSFLDQNGNIYAKNTILAENSIHTKSLQLLPSEKPDSQIGRQYVNKDTGNLMYFDGLDWINLNQNESSASASLQAIYDTGNTTLIGQSQDLDFTLGNSASSSATSFKVSLAGDQSIFGVYGGASQSLITIDDNATYPINITQPTWIAGNLNAPKLIDTDSSTYFLDPSATDLGLVLAGDATISATLKFSKNNGYITNDTNNYLTISGGLGLLGSTDYGFDSEADLIAHEGLFRDDLTVDAKLDANGVVELGDGDDTISINSSVWDISTAGAATGLISLGIGTTDPSEKLEVVGNIRVTSGSFIDDGTTLDVPDYVFEDNYQLLSPVSLQEFISTYHHLPGVPSRDEISQTGLNLSTIILNILEKTEENVLYILDLYDRVTNLEKRFLNPTVETEKLATNFISPLTDDGQIVIESSVIIGSEPFHSGVEPCLTGRQVDSSPDVELIVHGSASISGTLTANEIKSSTIDNIKDKISALVDKYDNQTATASAVPIDKGSEPSYAQLLASLQTADGSEPESSPSAHLDIASINANFGFFSDYLAVVGQIVTTDLKVNNTLTIGDNLIIGSSSITTLNGKLDLMAGLISLDTIGKVIINGDLIVNGKLTAHELETQTASISGTLIASEITPPIDKPLNINIASQSAISIYNEINKKVANINASGSATFSQLNLKSSGSATVSAGMNHTIINSQDLTDTSQVIITFGSDYKPATKYWVTKNIEQKTFTIFTNYPVNNPTKVDWLIIN
ncbi:MAG: MerR family transcriptional regulator [Patescibacteria group bacterium]|nr:MerR family transcriptional regulator [Patescibacteria group bacterium]